MTGLESQKLMAAYRVYRLDDLGKFKAVEAIEAASDQEALKIAEGLDNCPPCEVWDQARYVGKISASRAQGNA